jgi:hypothetical protein
MRPTHPDYEGLQVRAAENYPEVVHYSDKEALPPRNGPSQGKRTCRLARPVFIALLVVAVLVVVGAAVGGGVGAVLAAKNSKPSSVFVHSTMVLHSTAFTNTNWTVKRSPLRQQLPSQSAPSRLLLPLLLLL